MLHSTLLSASTLPTSNLELGPELLSIRYKNLYERSERGAMIGDSTTVQVWSGTAGAAHDLDFDAGSHADPRLTHFGFACFSYA